VLQAEPGVRVVGEAASAAEACDLAHVFSIDVALLDLDMPGGGLSAIGALRHRGVRVLVVSMHDEAIFVRAAQAAGADGYVSKASPPSALVAALRAVGEGRPSWPRCARIPVPDLSVLADREREALLLAGAGLTARETAQRLGISQKAVETYRLRAIRKLGLESRSDLGVMAELLRCGAGTNQ
jgi:DNA-binding NarL/FixJ family response regulator